MDAKRVASSLLPITGLAMAGMLWTAISWYILTTLQSTGRRARSLAAPVGKAWRDGQEHGAARLQPDSSPAFCSAR
jgi:hypothetical protein